MEECRDNNFERHVGLENGFCPSNVSASNPIVAISPIFAPNFGILRAFEVFSEQLVFLWSMDAVRMLSSSVLKYPPFHAIIVLLHLRSVSERSIL